MACKFFFIIPMKGAFEYKTWSAEDISLFLCIYLIVGVFDKGSTYQIRASLMDILIILLSIFGSTMSIKERKFIGTTNEPEGFYDPVIDTKVHKIACDGVIFNHVYYDKSFITGNLGRPYNLIYHKFSNTIYFSHTVQKNTDVDFIISVCNVEKKDCMDIKGVPGGYAIAYDMGNDDIFLGGHDGIYKYNFIQRKAEIFAERGKSIWGIFIRRNFYYIEYPSQKLFVYKDDEFVEVYEARGIEIDNFFVSKFGDIYFSNKTALYKVARPSKDVLVLNDDLVIRQIAEDNYGDVHFCANDGIYIEDKPYTKLKKLADIHNAFGVAFDVKDHLIYSDSDSIYRLLPSKYAHVCYRALRSHAEIEHRKQLVL